MNVIKPSFTWLGGEAPNGHRILELITKAGRVAYQSDKTGGDEEFVRNLISRGHESVLEHCKVSVVVTCDRGITHEIVRHRIASYTQESTRFCNYSKDKFDGEITYIDLMGGIHHDKVVSNLSVHQIKDILKEWTKACEDAERHYIKMIELGATPQIARSVLNNSTKTSIVITFNMREWRHFFKLRNAPDAHPQMREITEKMLSVFKETIPVIFDDI